MLQDQEFERLGSNRTIRVNLRLVAATNRDLAKGMALHEFRSDLFYRLSVFPIRVPLLSERREDIPLLIRFFVRKFALRMDRNIETIPKETMKALIEWSWPGNVRELENLMERSVILSDGNALHVPLAEMRAEGRTPDSQVRARITARITVSITPSASTSCACSARPTAYSPAPTEPRVAWA